MLTYKKRNSTYKKRQTIVKAPEITINFKKRKEKDEIVENQQNDTNLMIPTNDTNNLTNDITVQINTDTNIGSESSENNKEQQQQSQIQTVPEKIPLSPTSTINNGLENIKIQSPNASPISNNNSNTSMEKNDISVYITPIKKENIPFSDLDSSSSSLSDNNNNSSNSAKKKSSLEMSASKSQSKRDTVTTPKNKPKSNSNINGSSRKGSNSTTTTPVSTKKIKVKHNESITTSSETVSIEPMTIIQPEPPIPKPEPVKVMVSKDTKDILELLKPNLDQQLKAAPQNLKPFFRECLKKFTSEMMKLQVIKPNSVQHIQKHQSLLQQQQHQHQELLTQQQQEQQKQLLVLQQQQQQQLMEAVKPYKNIKVLEVERRISTMISLVNRWKREEQQWTSILSEFTQSTTSSSSNQNQQQQTISNNSINLNASLLKTPSRSTRTAPTTLNSTAKKKQPPQIPNTPFKSNSVNLTNSFLSTLNSMENGNSNVENQQTTTEPKQITEDPRIAQIRDSILSITMRLDEVRPRLKQVENTTLEIQSYYNDLSLHFHDQLFTKQHKYINQSNKLLSNLKAMSISIENEKQEEQVKTEAEQTH